MPEWPFSVNGSGEGVVIDLVVTEEGRRAIKNGIWMEQTSFNGY